MDIASDPKFSSVLSLALSVYKISENVQVIDMYCELYPCGPKLPSVSLYLLQPLSICIQNVQLYVQNRDSKFNK